MQTALTLTGTVSLFAGSPTAAVGMTNGTGAAAMFSNPNGITTDGTNLYVADQSNNQIRQIAIATGAVTLLAGSPTGAFGMANGTGTAALFLHPNAITTDGTNLYVADSGNNQIRKIVIATGAVTLLAGSPTGAAGLTNGSGTAALFNLPVGITNDGKNLYVSDYSNHEIRQIAIATGAVTLLAGSPTGASGRTDGRGTAALFGGPRSITTDGTNLYVAEIGNNDIRQIVIATGAVSLLAGSPVGAMGVTNGKGAAALFNLPYGITTDGTNLYVADMQANQIRQIVIATGNVTLLTGHPGLALGLANGPKGSARFSGPVAITSDGTSLYVSDYNNNEIRKIQ